MKRESHQEFWNTVKDYSNDVFSVLEDPKARKTLVSYIATLSQDAVVADLGCGPGNLLPILARQFKHVYAVDYADKMLKKAQANNAEEKNITYLKSDLKNLKKIKDTFNIAFSINSLLPPKISEADIILKEIFHSLKKGGVFVAIIPSADVVAHLALLEVEKKLKQGQDENASILAVEKEFENTRKTSILGFHRDSSKNPRQKYFYPFEIDWRLKKAGFSKIERKKNYYTWKYTKDHHYGYHPGFEKIWDWFVIARK